MVSFEHNTFGNYPIPTKTCTRIFSNNALQSLKFELEEESWQKVYQASCVNESYDHFLNIIVAVMDKYARQKTINTHYSLRDEWLTDNIRTLSKIKRQLYEGMITQRISQEDYNNFCDFLKNEIEKSKKETYSNHIIRSRSTWDVIHHLQGQNNKQHTCSLELFKD
ncbi:hypothetical protein QE152_g35095 [Popillia japonica]|uniref:Uncharacterized protein n=1 Tax=Popillia japonica TaxID=7064 RepID=A0AAW1ISJ5_POPJA